MKRIISQLTEFDRENEKLVLSYGEIVKQKEELLQRLIETENKLDTMYNNHQREREAKLAAIRNLKEAKKAQERAANIKFNQLKDEMSMMTSRTDYDRVLSELEALKVENGKLCAQIESLRKARNELVVENFKPEEVFFSQFDLQETKGAFATGFSLSENK